MTLQKLAQLAHVSVSTVSKAFHGAADVSVATKERIFALAKEHGCYGKYRKERFSKRVIALICPELGSAFYSAFAERFQALVEGEGGILLISADHFDNERQAELLDYYAAHLRVDGIIVIDLRVPLKPGYILPIVSLGKTGSDVTRVYVDPAPAVDRLVARLKEEGHRRFAFVGETKTTGKLKLFQAALRRHRLNVSPELTVVRPERFEAAGEAGMDQLLRNGCPFTAVACAYDDIALGAIKALHRAGLRVPEDVSVFGFDDIPLARYAELPLTTVSYRAEEACELVCDILRQKIENPYFSPRPLTRIPGEVIWRSTTGPRGE